MTVTRREPVLRTVATVAGKRRREMPAGRSGRNRPVVTGVAGTGRDRRMVKVRRGPTVDRVAELAIIIARNMSDVLSRRDRAIMTAEAIRSNARMIKSRRDPTIGPVAKLAIVAARNMSNILPRRDRAVVTAEAAPGHTRMVETRRG